MKKDNQMKKFHRQQTMFLDDVISRKTQSQETNGTGSSTDRSQSEQSMNSDLSDIAQIRDTHENAQSTDRVRNCDHCRIAGVRLVSMSNYMGIGLGNRE